MNKIFTYLFLTAIIAISFAQSANAQVDVTSTGGTPSASYTTLKSAFDAINAGTHTLVITIGISANTTETDSAVINGSGTGSAHRPSRSRSPCATMPRRPAGVR